MYKCKKPFKTLNKINFKKDQDQVILKKVIIKIKKVLRHKFLQILV